MPILGPLYAEVISGHTLLVYVALALVPVTWWLLYRTRFGLRLRAVGKTRPRWIRRVFRWCGCGLPPC